MEQLPREGGCALCPQRLSRPGQTKPTATWSHLALNQKRLEGPSILSYARILSKH